MYRIKYSKKKRRKNIERKEQNNGEISKIGMVWVKDVIVEW